MYKKEGACNGCTARLCNRWHDDTYLIEGPMVQIIGMVVPCIAAYMMNNAQVGHTLLARTLAGHKLASLYIIVYIMLTGLVC